MRYRLEERLGAFFSIEEDVMMRTKVFIVISAGFGLVFALCYHLGFCLQEEITLQQKTAEADLIVVGTVNNVEARWNDPTSKSQIYTYVSLSLKEDVKGSSPDKDITIRILGGEVDGIGARVEGMPVFLKGEKVLVFLIRDLHSDNFFVLGGTAGKYQIGPDNMVGSTGKTLPEFLNEVRLYIDK